MHQLLSLSEERMLNILMKDSLQLLLFMIIC